MIPKYNIEPVAGILTEIDMQILFKQFKGQKGTLTYASNEEDGITFGDFIVKISVDDIHLLESCFKSIVPLEDDLKDTSLPSKFRCIVVHQKNLIVQFVNLDFSICKPFTLEPESEFDSTKLFFIFFQEEEGYILDYDIVASPGNKNATASMFHMVGENETPDKDEFKFQPN